MDNWIFLIWFNYFNFLIDFVWKKNIFVKKELFVWLWSFFLWYRIVCMKKKLFYDFKLFLWQKKHLCEIRIICVTKKTILYDDETGAIIVYMCMHRFLSIKIAQVMFKNTTLKKRNEKLITWHNLLLIYIWKFSTIIFFVPSSL